MAEKRWHDIGLDRLIEIFLGGIGGRKPAVPIDPQELVRRAREVLSPSAATYVEGGAGHGATVRANRAAFDRWRIVPRMLRNVERRDLGVELFGQRLPAPILLAPVGVLDLFHPEGDLAVARAASAEGIPMIFSTQASSPMEACAALMGEGPRWFQLYWSASDELVASFLERAEACGCGAVVVTVDTTLLGWRPGDLDLADLPFLRGRGIAQYLHDPVFRKHVDEPLPSDSPASRHKPPLTLKTVGIGLEQVWRHPGSLKEKLSGQPRRAIQRFLGTYSRPSLTWDDLPRLRGMTKLPILVKGILHPDDARRTLDVGMDGIVVSNHGGRQVDGAVASMEALPGVLEAVGGKVPVLLDSGVRGGADALKALALGAAAVCLGRQYVYGLAIAGERGVREVIRNTIAELDLTLGLAGYTSIAELGPEALVQGPADFGACH